MIVDIINLLKSGKFLLVHRTEGAGKIGYVLSNIYSDGKDTIMMFDNWMDHPDYSKQMNIYGDTVKGDGPWTLGEFTIRELDEEKEPFHETLDHFYDVKSSMFHGTYDFEKGQNYVKDRFPL